MATRVPLVLDSAALYLKELPATDNLDLSTSAITDVGDINSSGIVTATTLVGRHGNIPNASKSSDYTLVVGDTGKLIITTGNITINNSIFSTGDIISVYNNSASGITLTQGSGVTLRLDGSATTGNRTLAQRGLATIICIQASEFAISGSAVT